MGPRARLFISHSSHSDESRSWLKTFAGALRAAPVAAEPFYDLETITSGKRWREVIHWMLWECDAAVVLLSPDALDSAWVLKEAAILKSRADRNAQFLLLPVLCGGVTKEQFAEAHAWRAIDLLELQCPPSGEPAEVAASVRAALAPVAAALRRGTLQRLSTQVARLLSAATEEQCRDVLAAIGESLPADLIDEPQRYARAIARWVLRQPPPALSRVAGALDELGRSFPVERIKEILKLVAPLWVDPEAASRLVQVRSRAHGPQHAALLCRKPTVTVRHYLESAYLPRHPPRMVQLNGVTAGAQVEDVAGELLAVLRRQRVEEEDDDSDDEINAELAEVDYPFYVSVGLPEDSEVVVRLQELYPKLTFVYHAGGADLRDTPHQPVTWVVPHLDPDEEHAALRDCRNALRRFDSA